MRRTYRSKKDAGGGLEHKNLLSTIDSKSSLFDAFYIQNIKQTKREMSCMGSSNHSNVAPYKVCKKKYVKRILKDVSTREESLRDSISQSAYLTPDKSLHVNKPPDPFDLLLKSSPAVTGSPILSFNVKGKKYSRKKTTKLKKFNCRNDDNTDSDKENTKAKFSDSSQNVTDLNFHRLIIEQENAKNDESIYTIVKKMPLFSSEIRSTQKKGITDNHRLTSTVNFKSPAIKNSPFCSTPFQEKYRSKSIYNFSPIIMNINDSPKVSLNDTNKCKIHKRINFSGNNTCDDSQHSMTHAQPLLDINSPTNDYSCNLEDKVIKQINGSKTKKNYELSDVDHENNTIFYTTEAEPFYGFALRSVTKEIDNNDNNIQKESTNNNSFKNSSVSILTRSFLGFDNVEIQDLAHANKVSNILSPKKIDRVTNLSVDTSVNCSLYAINNSINRENISVIDYSLLQDNITKENVMSSKNLNMNESDKTDDINTDSSKSEEIASQSLYDTCNSDESSINNDKIVYCAKPIVILERMNNSVFYKYYNKVENNTMQKEDSDITHSSSGNYSHFEGKDIPTDIFSESCVMGNENDDSAYSDYNISKERKAGLECDEDIKLNKSEEEDRCVSFVTTRRRNEITNNSLIFICDNSYGSTSSVDVDKTVISNCKDELHSENNNNDNLTPKTELIAYEIASNNELSNTNQGNSKPLSENINVVDLLSATKRNNTSIRESNNVKLDSDIGSELKLPIVLQPGKKWERSLSIYKRMTTMADNFDHSILDNEPMECKGRKYRQSVISTMEMQKCKGSLHNESVNSRRSTFVCKPSRTTIKIVKENRYSRASLCSTTIYDDLKASFYAFVQQKVFKAKCMYLSLQYTGFLSDDCDDTIVELSKLSIGDSEHEVTVLEKFHDTSRIATARDYVLRRCNQTEAILFDECYPDTELKNCHKIGEGVYGEVFLWRARDGRARVLKIIPIAGDIKVNGEPQKGYHEIISEIVIAMELSALRAPIAEIEKRFDEGKEIDALDLHSVENATDIFNEVLAVQCVYGGYPSRLLDLWDLYDECKGSENDNPAILPVDQHYIVLELANAGQDLESYQFNSAEQAHALFLQIAFGLAVAEEAFQFEHRDLHWGNVLILPTDQKFATFVLRGRTHRIGCCGVRATIIDYSLSRLSLRGGALFCDLSTDEALFDAVGDRQFTVYRLMRERLCNDWKNFEPYTNILWLDYIVDKMITSLRYKRTNTKIHKHYTAKLKAIKHRILDYGSAAQFVLTDNEF
ncbi:unnamed protein product [Parnassius apollo]|uniref:non-specific serine/threonine protein kinase n=1 Tax=Parnassius apollo TaxID=110799 RepID=A0A8S3WPW4_PARAO|nr:unnamed protein product [Parnassius apollo]